MWNYNLFYIHIIVVEEPRREESNQSNGSGSSSDSSSSDSSDSESEPENEAANLSNGGNDGPVGPYDEEKVMDLGKELIKKGICFHLEFSSCDGDSSWLIYYMYICLLFFRYDGCHSLGETVVEILFGGHHR